MWELTLSRLHKRYWHERKARVRQTFALERRAKGMCDFAGTINPKVPVFFDAKECGSDKFYLSKVPDHQVEELRAQHEMGAITFLCVRFTKLDKNVVFRYPFPDKKGLSPADGLVFGANGWLEVV